MSKSDIISRLMDEISSQNDWYLAAIGILITLTLFVSGFSIYAQLKLSDKQITKLKNEIRNDLVKEFALENISEIKSIDNNLTDLILINLRNITSELILKGGIYTSDFIMEKSMYLIGYIDILKNREIKNTEFIKNISNVFEMINGWCNRSAENNIDELVKMYLYRIYVDLTRKEDWKKVDGYNVAIENLKDTIRSLENFQYIDLDINEHN
ncbi:MAG: hypothetical protein LKJ39_11000 [Liquorilactobacillus nagelii]|jgi:hypothetical protein|uniref:hypothetical protein n=1 Tax=Liquorilactobacillus nagelii TaxID=82688 RepID=UPI00242F5CDE|nr:hypothetical protein [Liquorilactobacillus nagelii]MCI1977823.1 hypothetical protein [Liquorilactobacillus nagelii]MDY2688596.1 hypothetical protein [Limosilactobacillus reuteri]